MKKEIAFVIALAMFALAYVLDYIAGNISFSVRDQFAFLSGTYLMKYPLTGAGVFIRTLAIFLSIVLIYSVVEHKYFVKAFVSLLVTIFSEAYAIQQLSTGVRTTPVQWTLSIAYAGVLVALLVIYYIFKGIFFMLTKAFTGEEKKEFPEEILKHEEEETS